MTDISAQALTEDANISVTICIEGASDDEPYWRMDSKYLSPTTNIYDIIGEEEKNAFERIGSVEPDLVLMVDDVLLPETCKLEDLNPKDRSGVLLTRRSIEAKVKRAGFKSIRVVVDNGFTFLKLKQLIQEKTGIEVALQHIRSNCDVENRKSRALKNLSNSDEISQKSPEVRCFHMTQVDPLNIVFRSEMNNRDTPLTVSPKLTTQRLVQNLEIESRSRVDPSAYALLFGDLPLILTSPYGFLCAGISVNSSLEAYGVQNGDVLVFKKRDPEVRIHIKLISGTVKTIEGFSDNDYVGDLMWEVAKQNSWPTPDLMRLLWGGHTLDHTQRLSYYSQSVSNDTMIHMVPTMRRS